MEENVMLVREGETPAMIEWTQEQIDRYVARERVGLIRECLEVFEAKQVFKAAMDLFLDLFQSQLAKYMDMAQAIMVLGKKAQYPEINVF